jgi:hypothetical protein
MSFSGFENEDRIIEALNGKTFESITAIYRNLLKVVFQIIRV